MPFQRMWAHFFQCGILNSVIFMIIFLLQVNLSSVFETKLRRLMNQLPKRATFFLKTLVSAYRNVVFLRLHYIFVCQDTHSSLIKLIKLPARQMKFLFNQKQIFLKTNLVFIPLIKLKNELVWNDDDEFTVALAMLHCQNAFTLCMKLKLTILTNDEMDVIEHDVFRFAPNREY